MKAVLPGCRRAAISKEGIEIEGEFRGWCGTPILSHDTTYRPFGMQGEGGNIGSHKSPPLTRHSKKKKASLAGQNPSGWKVKPILVPIPSSAGGREFAWHSEGDDCASPGPIHSLRIS